MYEASHPKRDRQNATVKTRRTKNVTVTTHYLLMPEIIAATSFDPTQPVYVIKQFFYGANLSSIRHASDHPLRLDQIPVEKRTSEYLKQGRVRSNIPTMIVSEENNGIQIDSSKVIEAIVNPLEMPELLDKQGNVLPASAPMAQRNAAKKKQAEQNTSSVAETNSKNNSSK